MLCAKLKKVFLLEWTDGNLKIVQPQNGQSATFEKLFLHSKKNLLALKFATVAKTKIHDRVIFLGCRTICRKASLSKSQNGDVLKGQIVEMVTCWRGNLSKYSYLSKRLFVEMVIWQNVDLFNGKFLKWDILSKW